jgi:hypothetical protein
MHFPEFPDVEGFTRDKPQHFPNPKHGYVVIYKHARGWAVNVYLYNSGLAEIPDGASSEVVREEIALIEVGLKELQKQGSYRSFKELAHGEVSLGASPDAPVAQHRRFEIDRADVGLVVTDVSITGHRNRFVKIRCTFPAGETQEAVAGVAPLLTALGEMLTAASGS